jgi:hypothetical protein
LQSFCSNISLVYSDPDELLSLDVNCQLIRRPNHLFWADKFSGCLEHQTFKHILIIHADCFCDDWVKVLKSFQSAVDTFPQIGVWAPRVTNCNYANNQVFISKLNSHGLDLVAQTDAVVFGLSESICHRLKRIDYTSNIYGWGIDLLMVATAYVSNLHVVLDSSVLIDHSKDRGYGTEEARAQLIEFFRQFSAQEIILNRLLMSYIKYYAAGKSN